MREYGFEEGIDFNSLKNEQVRVEGNRSVKRDIIDHQLTLSMAKEISMIQRNEKGKQARLYFIECERRAQTAPPQFHIPTTLHEALRLAADENEGRLLAEQRRDEAIRTKAQIGDKILLEVFLTWEMN
jgi:anti-repressor protein